MNSRLFFRQIGLAQDCMLCGGRSPGTLLCAGCMADLPRLPAGRCARCALPLAGGGAPLCGACIKRPPAFERTQAAFSYGFPVDALVRRFKYAGTLALADLFAEALARHLADGPLPELILPMPLHPARLAARGYNQAAEIARRLAPRLGRPWHPTAARRLRDTPPQAGLELDARRRNLRGAFQCDAVVAGRRIALVDDVMTSGSSLNELARAARRAGALEVSAWVVARVV